MPGLDLKDLARRGAIARLTELQEETAAILRAFPDLRRGAKSAGHTDDGTTVRSNRRRGRKPMSAAQKKAVSVRMKAYWAKRKKAPRS